MERPTLRRTDAATLPPVTALPDLRPLVAHRVYRRLAFALQTELELAQDPELVAELLRARDCLARIRAYFCREGGGR